MDDTTGNKSVTESCKWVEKKAEAKQKRKRGKNQTEKLLQSVL